MNFLMFPENGTDYATFFHSVISGIEDVINRAIAEVRQSDRIQIELIGESARQHNSIISE